MRNIYPLNGTCWPTWSAGRFWRAYAMRGLIGLSNSSSAPCQYRPLCPPSSLTSFWANCWGMPPGGRAKYWFSASTNSRHASIAASSFLPIRRNTISSLPSDVSKYQEPWLFTKGIGNGQFSAPITSVTSPFGSVTNRCISWYLVTNPTRTSESSIGSPDESTSFPAGPRMRNGACSSCDSIAAKNSLPASSADVKVRCPGCCPNIGADKQPKESAKAADTANRMNLLSSPTAVENLCSMIFLSIFEFSINLLTRGCDQRRPPP